MRILEDIESEKLWAQIFHKFGFVPGMNCTHPFDINIPHEVFSLNEYWDEKQELLVQSILKEAGLNNLYAFDWQHLSFDFSVDENFLYGLTWFDEEHAFQVYFPSFSPMEIITFLLITNFQKVFWDIHGVKKYGL